MRVAPGDAELAGGIAGQILVRQEQHAVTLAEGQFIIFSALADVHTAPP